MIKRKIAYSLASVAVCALLAVTLYSADVSRAAALDALKFAAVSVVPMLFPFAVLARCLSAVGFPKIVYKLFPIHKPLGLPDCAAPALLCGLVGGFPVGAMLSADLYSRGLLTKGEAARLTAVSSSVSPAFLIGVAGPLFGSRAFGIRLWLAGTAVSYLCGVLLRFAPDDGTKLSQACKVDERSPAAVFCDAVTSSATACVAVVGYIVFFRTVTASVGTLFPQIYGFLALVTEFSGGVKYAAEIGSRAACSFAVGFGGISALMQVENHIGKHEIPVWQTVAVKLVSAAIMGGVLR